MSDDFDAARERRLMGLASKRVEQFADEVIGFLKAEPVTMAPADLGLKNAWEEYAFQIAEEESVLFSAYQDHVRDVCGAIFKGASATDRELCAVFTSGYIDWWFDRDDVPDRLKDLFPPEEEWVVVDIMKVVNERADDDGCAVAERIDAERPSDEDDET